MIHKKLYLMLWMELSRIYNLELVKIINKEIKDKEQMQGKTQGKIQLKMQVNREMEDNKQTKDIKRN